MQIAVGHPALGRVRRDEFDTYILKILDRELGLTLHGLRIGSSRDDSMRELTKTTASLYAERILLELIQNAYDGSSGTQQSKILVRLDLQAGLHGTVYVANDGTGFTKANVDAIVNPALSNKRPGGAIGHKGLGFRGVELISDDPQIYSVAGAATRRREGFDGFCFRFASSEDERERLVGLNAGDLIDQVVGKTHHLQLPVPLPPEQPLEIRRFAEDGFATVVCVPLRDETAAQRAIDEWQALFSEKAPLALFLDRVTTLTMECVWIDGKIDRRTIKRQRRALPHYRVEPTLRLEEVSVDRYRYLLASSDVEPTRFRASVERAINEGYPLEKWLQWEGLPQVTLAIPLSADAREGRYYAFLPMDISAPFHGFLDAPFFPNPDRRGLSLRNPLNSMLLDAVAETCIELCQTLARSNEPSSELAAAAIDAISWFDGQRARLFAALRKAGLDPDSVPVPVARRRETEGRWAPLKDVTDWDDSELTSLKGSWIARVCGVPVLRRGLGARRVAALSDFADGAGWSLEPDASDWATWAPKLVADLAKQRKPRRSWEEFYADLAALPEVLPSLQGARIFLSADSTILAANDPNTAERPQLFICPSPTDGKRTRRRLMDARIFPPNSVTRSMVFADPALSWPPEVISAFVKAGLANEYSLRQVVARLGQLVGTRPSHRKVLAALGWAFSVWKSHRAQVEDTLKGSALLVPINGGHIPASKARFSVGWRDTDGEVMAELCARAKDTSRDIAALGDRLLPTWDEWPLKDRGSAGDWTQFLRLLGVRDDLVPLSKPTSMELWQWSDLLSSSSTHRARVERFTGSHWRTELQAQPQPQFRYRQGTYETGDTLMALPGQNAFDAFPPEAKLAYARLIVRFLDNVRPNRFTTKLTRVFGNYDSVEWPSPILAFLRHEGWVPIQAEHEVDWGAPHECWYAPRAEPLPRFVRRIDRSVRDALDASPALREVMVSKLGLRLWSSEQMAGERIAVLGRCLLEGIAEADRDTFRKAYREAWEQWAELHPDRQTLADNLIVPVEIAGRLLALPSPGEGSDILYVSDGSNPMLQQLVAALGKPVFGAPAGKAEICAEALASVLPHELKLLAQVALEVEVDDEVFTPASDSEPLIAAGREWLAEISALVLELRTGLTNRNTARARQNLYDALKRVRVRFARAVHVTVGNARGGLPAALHGVLPVPHPDHPTLLVEGAEALDWSTLASMGTGLALAIEQPSLAPSFKLAFLALARQVPSGTFEWPDDEVVALALEQPVERIPRDLPLAAVDLTAAPRDSRAGDPSEVRGQRC